MGGSAVSSGTDLSADVYEPGTDVDLLETQAKLQVAVQTLIAGIGEDLQRDGLRDTPKRVAKAWLDASSGYRKTAKSVVGGALFHEPEIAKASGGLVIVRDIDFASTSETSLLPFYGRCHVGYLPSHGVVLGLSKVARLVAMLAKRLQTQERFTQELLNTFEAEVLPQGCAVVVEANQLEYGQKARINVTSARSGCFLQPEVMEEFNTLLRLSGAAKRKAVRDLTEGTGMHPPQGASSAQKLSDDIRLRYSASSAVTNGLEECMDEAEHEGGTEVSAALEGAVLTILREIGEDPGREGLRGSAQRYVKFLLASTAGYKEPMMQQDGRMDTCSASSQHGRRQLLPAKELHIHFMSHCEHHMLPFHGQVHIAYVPGHQHPVPSEQLKALVKTCSRRLQIQERLTQEIADGVDSLTGGAGALVACEASHMCMVARGVEKHASSTITTAARGAYLQYTAVRADTLQHLMQYQDESESG